LKENNRHLHPSELVESNLVTSILQSRFFLYSIFILVYWLCCFCDFAKFAFFEHVFQALKTGLFPNAQCTQNLPSTSILTGPPPPQQIATPSHPYSQHTLPVPPLTNMIGYPYLPQNYATYLPSIFQQAYASNGPFHQSAAAVSGSGMKYTMQEYKNTLSASGLQQQPSSVISGYGGGFGSTSNLPGNFTLNQNTGSVSSTVGFDDALSRQFKDNGQYMVLQQQVFDPGCLI
jgi:hypothetical protein